MNNTHTHTHTHAHAHIYVTSKIPVDFNKYKPVHFSCIARYSDSISLHSYSYFIDSCKRLKSAYIILVVANLVDYKSYNQDKETRFNMSLFCYITLF